MAKTYSPDGWVIVKLEGDDPHYRVFASFRGGYARGDAWQLNSGIVRAAFVEELGVYQFDGHSGSIYYCSKNSYGNLGMYCQSVLDNFIEKSHNTMVMLDDEDDWTTKDWILK